MIKTAFRFLCGIFFVVAGSFHFFARETYLKAMPTYIPMHLELLYLSGFLLMSFGILLFFRKSAFYGAWGLIFMLILMSPVNINMALHPDLFLSVPAWVYWVRLPFQFIFIAWVAWVGMNEGEKG